MPVKSKSETKTARKGKSRAELRRELAHHLAAVCSNPETPISLFNYIVEGMADLYNSIGGAQLDTSEQYISALLDEYAKAQKGGAN